MVLDSLTNFNFGYISLFTEEPSPVAQLVVLRTSEQEVAGSIPGSANVPSEDWR